MVGIQVDIEIESNHIQQTMFYYSGSRRFKGRFEGIKFMIEVLQVASFGL